MTEQELNDIKNALIKYLMADVYGNFEHLTVAEKQIIGDQETFLALLQSINTQGGE
tara:strand:- start:1524 stop:1691 length:168 start_codon:yes stop_codon:yes gene_type:complete